MRLRSRASQCPSGDRTGHGMGPLHRAIGRGMGWDPCTGRSDGAWDGTLAQGDRLPCVSGVARGRGTGGALSAALILTMKLVECRSILMYSGISAFVAPIWQDGN